MGQSNGGLDRATLSCIQYYGSCPDWYTRARRRKQKMTSKTARKFHEQFTSENPEVEIYVQPRPTEINPYWAAEIELGPTPAPRRGRKGVATGARGLHSSGSGTASNGSSRDGPAAANSPQGYQKNEGMVAEPQSSPDDPKWNHRLYQRENEQLWGQKKTRVITEPPQAHQGIASSSNVTRLATTSSTQSGHSSLHARSTQTFEPLIVATPLHKNKQAWMLQPPPIAKIMEGKVHPNLRPKEVFGRDESAIAAGQRHDRDTPEPEEPGKQQQQPSEHSVNSKSKSKLKSPTVDIREDGSSDATSSFPTITASPPPALDEPLETIKTLQPEAESPLANMLNSSGHASPALNSRSVSPAPGNLTSQISKPQNLRKGKNRAVTDADEREYTEIPKIGTDEFPDFKFPDYTTKKRNVDYVLPDSLHPMGRWSVDLGEFLSENTTRIH